MTLVCFVFYRLSSVKQSKVYLPEAPFPHAEVKLIEALIVLIYSTTSSFTCALAQLAFWIEHENQLWLWVALSILKACSIDAISCVLCPNIHFVEEILLLVWLKKEFSSYVKKHFFLNHLHWIFLVPVFRCFWWHFSDEFIMDLWLFLFVCSWWKAIVWSIFQALAVSREL